MRPWGRRSTLDAHCRSLTDRLPISFANSCLGPPKARRMLGGWSMSAHLQVAARTDAGCVRANNEDAFVVADLTHSSTHAGARYCGGLDVDARGVLLAVSDGIG